MKKLLVLASLLVINTAFAKDLKRWDYSKENQENWADMHQDFYKCTKGKNQSPINITDTIEADLSPIKFSYKSSEYSLENKGYTLQINYLDGGSANMNNTDYKLMQMHIHTPSENFINGEQFPLEIHLVHFDKDQNIMVVGVMLKEGKHNKAFNDFIKYMPTKKGKKDIKKKTLASDLLPSSSNEYYRFSGSLTTPPCTEGVKWIVKKEASEVSKEQLAKLFELLPIENNRKIQNLNNRPVLQ